jgi:hypothetical protein
VPDFDWVLVALPAMKLVPVAAANHLSGLSTVVLSVAKLVALSAIQIPHQELSLIIMTATRYVIHHLWVSQNQQLRVRIPFTWCATMHCNIVRREFLVRSHL